MTLNGDRNFYSNESIYESYTFVASETAPKKDGQLMEENTDHASVAGLEVLQFEAYKKQLDALTATEGSLFKGFSPRWTIPVRLRNPSTAVNTSCLLIVIDSAREVR